MSVSFSTSSKAFEIINRAGLDKVPAFDVRTLDIYKKCVPKIDIALPELSNFKHRISYIMALNNEVIEAKQKSGMHQVLSITLLVVSISIIATTIILATVVNPLFGWMAFACIIPGIISEMSMSSLLGKNPTSFLPAMIPGLLEGLYIYFAFTDEPSREKGINAQIEATLNNKNIDCIRKIVKHKLAIENSIKNELKKIDLTNLNHNYDFDHTAQLRTALVDLQKADDLILQLAV